MSVLTGKFCSLVTWREEFADPIVEHANNIKVWRNLLDIFPHPYSREDALSWIISQKDTLVQRANFAICVTQNTELDTVKFIPVGGIGLKTNEIANLRHVVEVGYWLGEKYWGKGIMTEALALITTYAFSEEFAKLNHNTRVERIQACIFEHNLPSGKVLQKNGYVVESKPKKMYVKEGMIIDGIMYIKLREQ